MSWSNRAVLPGGTETAFFFGQAGRRMFAVLHEPAAASPRAVPLLLVHPHFEEKLWAHRVLLTLSRAAAAAGHPVLRFDLPGHGDSEGAFEDFGFSDHEAAVDEARALLEERTAEQPVLLGLRLGATLAGRAAARHGGRTVLWEPVLDPAAWLYEALRTQLAFQMRQFGRVRINRNELVRQLQDGATVHIEGYGLTGRFYREACSSGGLAGPAFPGRATGVLAISIGRPAPSAGSALEAAARSWGSSACVARRHVVDDPFWSDVRRHRTRNEDLFGKTLDWIAGRPAGGDP